MRSLVLAVFVSLASWAQAQPPGELIFPAQDKHCHGSSVVECPNGDLLAVWFYGSGERTADDVLVQGARLKKGDTAWSPVFVAADTPGFPDCNPVLYIDAKQRLWLIWVPVLANSWEDCLLKYRRAEDYQGEGAPKWSWQDVIVLKPGDEFKKGLETGFDELSPEEGLWAAYAPQYTKQIIAAADDKLKRQLGWMTRIHPLTLESGRILLPLYSDGFNVSLAAISDDTGETWRASAPMVGMGPIQPTLVPRKDGSIAAYFRDSGGAPQRVMMSTSADNGDTWSVARDTELPNPSSSLEAVALKDGRWVLVHNDTEDGRHSLAVAMSDDEGKTWKWKRHIEKAEPGKGSFAYPSMIQSADGNIHITYTHNIDEKKSIKHVVFAPDWVAGQ
ncbi:MAG: sialidase family protein [FCB group bacterium]|jgi:predicted neuraminidase|nr:sialidase family protein [FCB group bacterium]